MKKIIAKVANPGTFKGSNLGCITTYCTTVVQYRAVGMVSVTVTWYHESVYV